MPANNGTHPTRETSAPIFFRLAGGRAMQGVRLIPLSRAMRVIGKRRLLIAIAVLTCLAALGTYAYYAIKRAEREFLESKYVRTTTATVTGKEFYRCEAEGCSYADGYGDLIEMNPGETQRRVYYRIDNFDQVAEPRRSRAVQAEKERVANSGARFTPAVDWYDDVKAGDKVLVRYRVFSDGHIHVWAVTESK